MKVVMLKKNIKKKQRKSRLNPPNLISAEERGAYQVHSIRIYSRPLTEEEREINHTVHMTRF